MKKFFVGFVFLVAIACAKVEECDVLVVGGTTSGTSAGITSARMGAKTIIIEPNKWLGGMLTSAGVSATDGNYKLRGAIWGELRDSLEAEYGGPEALKTGWVSHVMFEPHVGNRIFQNIANREENLKLKFNTEVLSFTQMKDDSWEVETTSGLIRAKVLIDATELGDVAKAVGVDYRIGMDASSETGEHIAPEEANEIVQDLTYVAVLKDYKEDRTIPMPNGYNPEVFACACENVNCIKPKEEKRLWSKDKLITYGELPNGKYMINWPIEGNDYYLELVDMMPELRGEAEAMAKHHTMCFLYFIQTELGYNTLDLADDEFPTEDNLPITPYHRESRRIHGKVYFTLNHITDPYTQDQPLYRTAIAVGDYPVDQHHTRYSGWSDLPDLYFYPIPSYGLPLGVMIPKDKKSLVVAEKSISVTNIVNGSSRLQPVVLQIGEAAGRLAAISVKKNCDVAEVSVRDVQRSTLAGGGYLLPYLDLDQKHPHFKALQRIGVTGIIKGRGANVGWENQTWFDAEKNISLRELTEGLSEVYSEIKTIESDDQVNLITLTEQLKKQNLELSVERIASSWKNLKLADLDIERPLTRLEVAVLIDSFINPFLGKEVDIYGNFKN